MTDERDPVRLLDPESGADPLLREVLQRTSSTTPSAAQLQALALKVSAASAAPALATAAPSLLAKFGIVKLSAALLIAGSAAWWGWSLLPASPPDRAARLDVEASAPVAAPRAVAAPQPGGTRAPASGGTAVPVAPAIAAASAPERVPAHSGEPAGAPEPPIVRAEGSSPRPKRPAPGETRSSSRVPGRGAASALPRVSGQPAATAVEREQPAASATAVEAPATPQAVDSELSLLSRAQGLLARDPQAALEVMNEHAHAYPRGEFAQEREALAIDALRRLGRRQELQTRARAFLQRYPVSPHRDRIEAWVK